MAGKRHAHNRPRIPQIQSSKVYAIGESDGQGGFALWHGPTPILQHVLDQIGESSMSRVLEIVDCEPNGMQQTVLYRWDDDNLEWIHVAGSG